jgi:hypothetical protein
MIKRAMTKTVASQESTSIRRGLRSTSPVRRFALGVATGFVLAVSLLAACGANYTEEDTLFVKEHLYLNGPGGTKYEIGINKDASGKDIVTAPVSK